jgi:hypothetical protein
MRSNMPTPTVLAPAPRSPPHSVGSSGSVFSQSGLGYPVARHLKHGPVSSHGGDRPRERHDRCPATQTRRRIRFKQLQAVTVLRKVGRKDSARICPEAVKAVVASLWCR